MRSMIIGCALLLFGSCAALAQQDTPVQQGGSPNAPAAAPSPTSPAPAMAAPTDGTAAKMPQSGMAMKAMHRRPMMKHHRGMMHRRMMRHHMMMRHGMMMHRIPAAKGRYNKG